MKPGYLMLKPIRHANAGMTCLYREAGLVFSFQHNKEGKRVGALMHCCIVTHDGGGYVKICDYSGGPLPIDTILETRKKLENYGEPKCAGCVLLAKPSIEKPKYHFNLLNFSHFNFCNLRCKYCYLMMPEFAGLINKVEPYIEVLEPLQEMIDKNWLDPNGEAHWGGGEPVLLKGFDEIQSTALNYGLKVTLNTNATKISDTVLAHAHNPRQMIVCSVDAGTTEQYAETKGRNLGEKVWKNLKVYADSGVNLTLKYIVSDDNDKPEEADMFLEKASELGSPFIAVDLDYRKGIIDDSRIKFAKDLLQKAKNAGFESSIGGPGYVAFTTDPFN